MGQVPPQAPPFSARKPLTVSAQAKCDYCGRYGALGSCEGCGAPNKPALPSVLQSSRALGASQIVKIQAEWVEVTNFGDSKRRFIKVSDDIA